MKELLSRYSNRLGALVPWAFPLKMILSGLLAALGGAGLLGFLSEYATYGYAIHYGFRPPLEGIPYLKATVALGSLMLLLTGAAVFLLSLLIVRIVAWSIEWPLAVSSQIIGRGTRTKHPSPSERFRTVFQRLSARPAWQILVFSLCTAIAVGVFTYFEGVFLNNLSIAGKKPIDPFVLAAFGALYGFAVVLAMTSRRAIWIIGGAATLAYFVVWIYLLFSPSWYASFLRTVGYGGGIPISIQFNEAQADGSRTAEVSLLLRTTEALLVLSKEGASVTEIPRDEIRTITHASGGLRMLPHTLPTTSGAE